MLQLLFSMNVAPMSSVAVERLDADTSANSAQVFLHKQRYNFALRQITPQDTVLEIGTGTGYFSKILADRCQSYSGLEIDSESCEITRQRVGAKGQILQADAHILPFPDQSFSVIIILEVLEHLENFRKAIQEIHRCLQPQGKVIVSVPYRRKGGKNPQNPYHIYEPGAHELVQAFQKYFGRVELFYQYFAETKLMTAARLFHFRRFVGLAQVYGDLWNGVPSALERVAVDPAGKGMRITSLLVASQKK